MKKIDQFNWLILAFKKSHHKLSYLCLETWKKSGIQSLNYSTTCWFLLLGNYFVVFCIKTDLHNNVLINWLVLCCAQNDTFVVSLITLSIIIWNFLLGLCDNFSTFRIQNCLFNDKDKCIRRFFWQNFLYPFKISRML